MVLTPAEKDALADAADPRLAWLLAAARGWREAGNKTLVSVAHHETLELVRTALSHRAQIASAAFQEGLNRRPLRTGRVAPEFVASTAFSERVQRLGALLDPKRPVAALAAVVFSEPF